MGRPKGTSEVLRVLRKAGPEQVTELKRMAEEARTAGKVDVEHAIRKTLLTLAMQADKAIKRPKPESDGARPGEETPHAEDWPWDRAEAQS